MYQSWHNFSGGAWSSGQTLHITTTYVALPPPTCACGAVATTAVEFRDGRRTPVCAPCQERTLREHAIANAQQLLAGLFCAVGVEQRARLYKQLAIVFHPDQGGDERLMTVLNEVRKAFPG